jgi:hypothetical protein
VTSGAGDNRRPRGGRGRFVRSRETAARDARAAQLRVEGLTYQAIADRLGFTHRDLARRAVERVLLATVREVGDELRALELARLDRLWAAAWQVMNADHPVVSHGRVVVDEVGVPVSDWRPVLAAIDRLLRVMERRSALLGLDAPRNAPGGLSLAQIEAEIDRLEAGEE